MARKREVIFTEQELADLNESILENLNLKSIGERVLGLRKDLVDAINQLYTEVREIADAKIIPFPRKREEREKQKSHAL